MRGFLFLVVVFFASAGFASQGLTLHVSEFGVGKFHRADNKAHAYGASHAWLPYILPVGASASQALTLKNADGSYSVYYSTLEEMFNEVVRIAKSERRPVAVLNIHGHGLPGAMWFPKDKATLNSFSCLDWRRAANGSDADNYNQYYSPVSVAEIEQLREASKRSELQMPCTTGLNEWQQILAKIPEFKSSLARDAQVHFLSCIVGLGVAGERFTKGIAALLLESEGRVETSVNFGLGDWSMTRGMGFWDFVTEEQVRRDGQRYPVTRNDSEIAQKGTIRAAQFSGKDWTTMLIANRDFMGLEFETRPPVPFMTEERELAEPIGQLPRAIRVPGTGSYVQVSE